MKKRELSKLAKIVVKYFPRMKLQTFKALERSLENLNKPIDRKEWTRIIGNWEYKQKGLARDYDKLVREIRKQFKGRII